MSISEKQAEVSVNTSSIKGYPTPPRNADDKLLAELGYKAEFKREFSVSPSLTTARMEAKIILAR
ncbi:uncharacterized protein BJ212DRAFT_436564 [Suillus subaureus]|uniref:Uncharacterized protein n=1 Tax=Suillus subaureus TaxID=48587 RepID=A0A9P7E736_9AGAM|nr:uncharacterized protein BJ212DRAFT_436564 [Suillus subaureus]KAG1812866.1 hypothetical protein BJ212DRAFT_436564 [Suillus subaureus]